MVVNVTALPGPKTRYHTISKLQHTQAAVPFAVAAYTLTAPTIAFRPGRSTHHAPAAHMALTEGLSHQQTSPHHPYTSIAGWHTQCPGLSWSTSPVSCCLHGITRFCCCLLLLLVLLLLVLLCATQRCCDSSRSAAAQVCQAVHWHSALPAQLTLSELTYSGQCVLAEFSIIFSMDGLPFKLGHFG